MINIDYVKYAVKKFCTCTRCAAGANSNVPGLTVGDLFQENSTNTVYAVVKIDMEERSYTVFTSDFRISRRALHAAEYCRHLLSI